MSNAGSALMGIGSARGDDRAVSAAEMAVSSPLLEASIDGAHGVLLSIAGGSDLGLKHGQHLDFNKMAPEFQGYALGADGALTTAHYQLCSRPAKSDAHMSNLLLLMAQRMGVEIDQFADSNRVVAL